MKTSWWKVPLYCMVAGWICFELEVRLLGRFAIVTLPDGSITSDNTRWIIMCGILFVITIAVGGLFFFRRMSRRELFVSASVMVVLNVVCGLIAYKTNSVFSFYWTELTEWSSFVPQLLYRLQVNEWISAILTWALPYLFLLFGKRRSNGPPQQG